MRSTFVEVTGRRGMTRAGIVVIYSDGLDRGDPEVLADALKSLAAQPELPLKLARKGKARIRQSYTIDNMVDRYVELYRTIAKGAFSSDEMQSTRCA